MIKIFSVDDDNNFLDAIAKFFAPFPEQYEVVGRYGAVDDEEGIEELLETIEDAMPDLVLMDFDFHTVGSRPDDFGIELTRRIIKLLPKQKVVMLTDDYPYNNDKVLAKVKRSFQAGAIAYLRKDEPHTWLECIREMAISGSPTYSIPETILEIMKERLTKVNTFKLTNREVEAIQHLADGKKTNEVAEAMGIGFGGANFHIDNAKIKLGVKTLQGLVAMALRHGIVI
ncbi:MAG: DNA-binding response regulator [Saprospiraceae bacterium]